MKNYQPPSETYWILFAITAFILAAWRLYVYYRPSAAEIEKVRILEEKRAKLKAGLEARKTIPDNVQQAINTDKKAPPIFTREKPITTEWENVKIKK